MVLAWSHDRVGPMTRTAEDAAMVFNVIHGSDPKDPGSLTMPFRFNHNINLANLRIGVRAQNAQNPNANFVAFLNKLKELGAKPVDIPNPPTVAGSQGTSINIESAAAFDFYVQFKARELGLTMEQVQERFGGRGGGAGRGRGAGADTTAAGRAAAAGAGADTTAGRAAAGGGAGGGRGGGGGRGSADNEGQLNRWVPGRTVTAMDFLNSQRRRLMLITAWQEYLKDIDLYIGASDGVHNQTGHPVVVLQHAFGVTGGGRGGGGGGGGRGGGADSTAAAAQPQQPALNPQPITTQIAGNLYNDDLILSVAHKYQINTKWHLERPKLP
jgi:hypothetical protein